MIEGSRPREGELSPETSTLRRPCTLRLLACAVCIAILTFGALAPGGAQPSPQRGGVMRVATNADPPGLDLMWQTSTISLNISQHVFETLLTLSARCTKGVDGDPQGPSPAATAPSWSGRRGGSGTVTRIFTAACNALEPCMTTSCFA